LLEKHNRKTASSAGMRCKITEQLIPAKVKQEGKSLKWINFTAVF